MITRTVASIALSCLVSVSGGADDKPSHQPGRDHGQEQLHFDVTPPSSIGEAWTQIGNKLAEAETLLAQNKLADVHTAGEYLESAVHVLWKTSETIGSGEQSVRLLSALKQLDREVVALHHAAEHGKSTDVAFEVQKIKTLLPIIEKLFPAGFLQQGGQ